MEHVSVETSSFLKAIEKHPFLASYCLHFWVLSALLYCQDYLQVFPTLQHPGILSSSLIFPLYI